MEGSATTRRDIYIELVRCLRFWDIREKVTLRRLRCSYKVNIAILTMMIMMTTCGLDSLVRYYDIKTHDI